MSLVSSTAPTSTLPYTSVGTRIRKSVEYVRHYYPLLRATLESGDLLLVVPASDFGYYIVRPDTMPEILSDKTFNLAVPYTSSIAAFTNTAGSTQNANLVTNFDVDRGEIAMYKLEVFDPGIYIQLQQPGGLSRFTDKAGTRKLYQQNTHYYGVTGQWGGVTEFWTLLLLVTAIAASAKTILRSRSPLLVRSSTKRLSGQG
jgi:hypothetical protein